jgi:hypothetical protein
MGDTFTFCDIERVCIALGMSPIKPGSKVWRGLGFDGRYRQTQVHSHGAGRSVATGTAKKLARDLHFRTLDEMAEYLRKL